MKSNKAILACLLVILFCVTVHAKVKRPAPRSSFSRYSEYDSLGASTDGIYFSLGAKSLFGKIGSQDDTTLESRSLSVFGAEAVLGYETSSVIFGLGADYNLWQQQTKATDVGNTNLAGSQFQFAGVLGYRWSPIILIGKYYFAGDYSMSRADATGEKAKYYAPDTNFSVQLLYGWSSSSHFGLEYLSGSYEKMNLSGSEFTLSPDTQLNTSAIGVVYVFIF